MLYINHFKHYLHNHIYQNPINLNIINQSDEAAANNVDSKIKPGVAEPLPKLKPADPNRRPSVKVRTMPNFMCRIVDFNVVVSLFLNTFLKSLQQHFFSVNFHYFLYLIFIKLNVLSMCYFCSKSNFLSFSNRRSKNLQWRRLLNKIFYFNCFFLFMFIYRRAEILIQLNIIQMRIFATFRHLFVTVSRIFFW